MAPATPGRHRTWRKLLLLFAVFAGLVYIIGTIVVALRLHHIMDPHTPPTKLTALSSSLSLSLSSSSSSLSSLSRSSSSSTSLPTPVHGDPPQRPAPTKPDNDQPRDNEAVKKETEAPTKNQKKPRARPNFIGNPHGHMVHPETVIPNSQNGPHAFQDDTSIGRVVPKDQILTAFAEPVQLTLTTTTTTTTSWKPLPVRNVHANDLTEIPYSRVNSCTKLPEQWPVDDYPDTDPFLPWIHDVFPTDDGRYLQFVAQNRQRCHTGTTEEEEAILEHTAPQVALFQHVPLKKVQQDNATIGMGQQTRYRLASHEDADPESLATRFICRFKPSGDVTFSIFNNDYEWVAFRKSQKKMFNEDGRNNNQIQTSQLLFKCPIPEHLVETVQTGASVVDDWATIFVDLIPVRTPPRYGPPEEFLVPFYANSLNQKPRSKFDPSTEWGTGHILPLFEDSGRWANIPVCKPSLMSYEPQALEVTEGDNGNNKKTKEHKLISCLWASTGYATRGNRYAINDGQRRLLEWISFNKILGFDHFYIYDNSGAFTNASSLQPIADVFPDDVTVIKWPSRVCNNNPNNVDSVGERSSQYAAESSCRLRFGPHTDWIGQFDIDEFLVPMGELDSLLPLLEKLDKEGTKIISFASWRAWPRRTHINDPIPINDKTLCGRKDECFELSVKNNVTMLEAYNCDRFKPGGKQKKMPAEKQLYRADYVKQHFIHYSTITETTNLPFDEYSKLFRAKRPFPDPKSRFGDEKVEGLMLHSKAIARQDTAGWKINCQAETDGFDQCRIGFPWPEDGSNATADKDGWAYNCYVNPRIDNYWAPQLQNKLKELGFK